MYFVLNKERKIQFNFYFNSRNIGKVRQFLLKRDVMSRKTLLKHQKIV